MLKQIDLLIKKASEQMDKNQNKDALRDLDKAIDGLNYIKPDKNRDALLARAYLYRGKALLPQDRKSAMADLTLGISYARFCKEPRIRAIAEKCLLFIQKEA